MPFEYISLGQLIVKYQVPLNIYNAINEIYERKIASLPKANKQLIGKINNEHSLFYAGPDNDRMRKNNFLTKDIFEFFVFCIKHYLKENKISEYKYSVDSIWVNEMKEHEYNPIHIHKGNIETGLSSVMILKLPPHGFGVEYSAADSPQNGRLQLLGSNSGQFAKTDFQPELKERDFYVFPYDLRHCVYPFNGPGTRRTLACNCDVVYDSLKSRGA